MELPKGWISIELSKLLEGIESGKRPKGGVKNIKNGIPSVGAEHLNNNGKFKFEKIKYVPEEFAKQMKKGVIQLYDILIVKDGATTGKTSFIDNDFPHKFAVINEHVFICRVKQSISKKYIFYKLWSNKGKDEILQDFRGAAQGGISTNFINLVEIPLPPLPEQHRIVEKIEELFSHLENGIDQLKKTKQQIKTYRQAVLKAAFEGKLTNENVNDGELPERWKKEKLIELCELITDGDHQAPPQSNQGVPFIVISNLSNGKIDFSNTRFVTKSYYEKLTDKKKPQKGDILYTVTGSFGIPIYINFEKEFCFQRHIGLIRPKKGIVDHKYLTFYLTSNSCYKQALAVATGTAQKTVPLKGLRNFIIPVPVIVEQKEIVSEIEERFSVADKLEESIDKSLQQAEAMRQSILKKAFEGKLVPQDENDEPASVLLKRIKTP